MVSSDLYHSVIPADRHLTGLWGLRRPVGSLLLEPEIFLLSQEFSCSTGVPAVRPHRSSVAGGKPLVPEFVVGMQIRLHNVTFKRTSFSRLENNTQDKCLAAPRAKGISQM